VNDIIFETVLPSSTVLLSACVLRCYRSCVLLDFTENSGCTRQCARNDINGSKDELHPSLADFAWVRSDVFHHKATGQQEGGGCSLHSAVIYSIVFIDINVCRDGAADGRT